MQTRTMKTRHLGNMLTIPISVYKGRHHIPTNLRNGDTALAYGSDTVLILKKYNCSAMVEYKDGWCTVINFDNLEKLNGEQTDDK